MIDRALHVRLVPTEGAFGTLRVYVIAASTHPPPPDPTPEDVRAVEVELARRLPQSTRWYVAPCCTLHESCRADPERAEECWQARNALRASE